MLVIKKNFALLIALIAMFATGSLFAIDDTFKSGKDADSQKAKELEETEKALDEKIKTLGESLQFYSKLDKIEVKYTPGQTNFSKGDGYIELESYNFIPQSYVYGNPVGTKVKKMRLYYSGETLSKIETEILEQDFYHKTKFYSKIVDPSPMDNNANDMIITTSFNDGKPYEVTVGDMENTLTNPLRINYKRDYYIEHLIYFEKSFRFTWEFQKRYGTSNDVVTIETLKKSLDY